MDVQTVIALSIVFACAAYVAWKYLRALLKPESAACHCASCPAAKDEACAAARPTTRARRSATHGVDV